MNVFSVIPVKNEQEINDLAALAREIWEEHFTPIIGEHQVSYMLEHFQSLPALTQAIYEDGYHYWFLCSNNEIVGYTGVHPDGKSLFLSKLYLKKEARGQGLARKAFSFLCGFAKKQGCDTIWLTCNRNNVNTLKVYDKFGFRIVKEQDSDIGNGFFMNDYVMEFSVKDIKK